MVGIDEVAGASPETLQCGSCKSSLEYKNGRTLKVSNTLGSSKIVSFPSGSPQKTLHAVSLKNSLWSTYFLGLDYIDGYRFVEAFLELVLLQPFLVDNFQYLQVSVIVSSTRDLWICGKSQKVSLEEISDRLGASQFKLFCSSVNHIDVHCSRNELRHKLFPT